MTDRNTRLFVHDESVCLELKIRYCDSLSVNAG